MRKTNKSKYFKDFCNLLLLSSCISASSQAQVNVLTANGGNERANANLQEYQLNTSNVAPGLFGKLATFPVDGLVYSQPLYVGGLSIPGRGTRDVLFVSTMHNSVYAFDANPSAPATPLWKVNFGTPVPSSVIFPVYSDIGSEAGILSTGTIDLQRGVIYVVAETLRTGTPIFSLHALDLTTGAEKLGGPTVITATVNQGGQTVAFDPKFHLQRPGLLLANGAVYIGFGSAADQVPWHGWVIAYDASNVSRQLAPFVTTPSGMGGGIWESGRGLAADSAGAIYAISGNGDYDGVANYGESFLKLTGTTMSVSDWYTPTGWKNMEDYDGDLSAGPALISGTHLMVGADKLGYVYLLDSSAMGKLGGGATKTVPPSGGLIFNFALWPRGTSTYIFQQGYGEGLRCLEITGNDINPTPLSTSSVIPDTSRVGITLSASGALSGTGIVWETTGDFSAAFTPGTLHAFDASNLANELWSSDTNGSQDRLGSFMKFVNPTVANGKVYVATGSNTVVVYGLLSQHSGGSAKPQITAVTNGASYDQDAIAPGELITIFGTNIGPAAPAQLQLDGSGLVATSIGDTRVLFDGVAAPMVYTSSGQVSAVVPFGVTSSTTQVQIEFQGQASEPFTVPIAPTYPGIFSADGSGSGQALILNQDGNLNAPDNPAAPGSAIVFYATGGGAMSPSVPDGSVTSGDNLAYPVQKVTATIGGVPATVLYAGGAPGMVAGVLQVNLTVPDGAGADGANEVVIQIGARASQSGLTVSLQAAPAAIALPVGQRAQGRRR